MTACRFTEADRSSAPTETDATSRGGSVGTNSHHPARIPSKHRDLYFKSQYVIRRKGAAIFCIWWTVSWESNEHITGLYGLNNASAVLMTCSLHALRSTDELQLCAPNTHQSSSVVTTNQTDQNPDRTQLWRRVWAQFQEDNEAPTLSGDKRARAVW